MVITTVALPDSLKRRLDKLKVHRREPYSDVVTRLIIFFEKNGGRG
jgi:predicted transcriptional regulator